MNLITNSLAECFKKCRKQYYWAYECRIRRAIDARPLRMGTTFHLGLDLLKKGESLDAALETIRTIYTPDMAIEAETVVALLNGYAWYWQDSPLTWLASEQSFQVPLCNPETGSASKLFALAGKIDGLVQLEDRRLAVGEHKLLGVDISTDSDVWRRLQLDSQISCYVYGARQLGHDVATVLYDVTRKPTIKPCPVAVTDDLGAKIVLDTHGLRVKTERGQWRQTGDAERGYVLQTREMTPEEWSKKLTTDIAERPAFYFARHEIPRLDQDIDEWQADLWDFQKTLRDAQTNGRWFKTVSFATCPFCPYFGLCTQRFDPNRDALPKGFQVVDNTHPELEDDSK